ncbi:hypothetical protein ACJJIQ_02480 [Microbulbifer sp. ANSA003]|uniref:hypothetical protein n=1 Tax=Microbulbifer sp. ANSA003 TaxID=3243360 RepID=UPI004041F69C
MDIANKPRDLPPATGNAPNLKPSFAPGEPAVWRSLWITLPAILGALMLWWTWNDMSWQRLDADYPLTLVNQLAYLAEVGFLTGVLWLSSSFFVQRFGWRNSLIFALLVCCALAIYLYRMRIYTQRVEWLGLLLATYGNCLFVYLCFGPGRFVKNTVEQEKTGLFGALFKMGALLWLGLLVALSVLIVLAHADGITHWLQAPWHQLEAQAVSAEWSQSELSFRGVQALALPLAGPYFIVVWRLLAKKGRLYRPYISEMPITVRREAWLIGTIYGIIFSSLIGLLSVSGILYQALYLEVDSSAGDWIIFEVGELAFIWNALLMLPAALVGRALGGWLAKRFGGSWITLACLGLMGWAVYAGGNLCKLLYYTEDTQLILPLTLRIALLSMALGGASGGLVHSLLGTFSPLQFRSICTWSMAIGAFGAFYMPLLFATPFSAYHPARIFNGLAALYGLCFVVYAIYCLRKRALSHRS